MLEKPIDNLLPFLGVFEKCSEVICIAMSIPETTIMYIDCLIKYQLTDRLSIINIPPIPNHYFIVISIINIQHKLHFRFYFKVELEKWYQIDT